LCKPKNLVPAKWNRAEQKEQSLHVHHHLLHQELSLKKGRKIWAKKEPQPFGWGLVITCYLLTGLLTSFWALTSAAFTATKSKLAFSAFSHLPIRSESTLLNLVSRNLRRLFLLRLFFLRLGKSVRNHAAKVSVTCRACVFFSLVSVFPFSLIRCV
jgi:hypothetical protein